MDVIEYIENRCFLITRRIYVDLVNKKKYCSSFKSTLSFKTAEIIKIAKKCIKANKKMIFLN